MIGIWLTLQGFVLLFWAVSEWALRSGQVSGSRWMRWLAALTVSLCWLPVSWTAPVGRLVPTQSAYERLTVAANASPATAAIASQSVSWAGLLGALATLACSAALLRVITQRWQLVRAQPARLRVGHVRVVFSDRVTSPCTVWLGRHWIVLDRVTAADPTSRHMAVLHEAQHIRHHDTLFAWLYTAIVVVSAINPLAWRLVRNLSELDELAVDHALVCTRRVSPRAYGRLLLATATHGSLLSASPGLAHTTPLHRRLDMLTRPHTRRIAPWLGAIALLASVAIAAPPMVPTVDTAFSDASYDALGIPNHAVVDAAIERLTVDERGKTFIEAALDRRPEHQTFVRDALTRAGLPVELEAVALIESGYDDQLTTGDIHSAAPAGGPIGAGLWMFIPATAREYGLRVDAQVDERLDLERETDAAIALLSDLYLEFGDWGLALAAYNQGPRHVHDAIQTHGTRDVPTLVQAGGLNRYVPTVWAGMLILSDD